MIIGYSQQEASIMRIEDIAKSDWRSSEATAAVVEHVETVLGGLSQGETIGSTRLLRLLMPNATDKENKSLLSHLYGERTKEMLEGYYSRGKPNGGTFGKPSVHWHAAKPKAPMTTKERRAAIKATMDPEDYAAIYGDDA